MFISRIKTMIDEYNEVRECDYKEEHYSVRDNGAIMRHSKLGKRRRKLDGVWTFGTKNFENGYMMLNSARVHIIVATAFYGEKDSKKYVVDHIDTNRCNNRVENLRWCTRLENALNNEITRAKIIYICGSIENFVENPSLLSKSPVLESSYEWMRTVTKEEAKLAYENNKRYWAEKIKNPTPMSGGKLSESIYHKEMNFPKPLMNKKFDATYRPSGIKMSSGCVSDDEWEVMTKSLRDSIAEQEATEARMEEKRKEEEDFRRQLIEERERLVNAKYPEIARQRYWRTPTEFLCCPMELGIKPLKDYFDRLVVGKEFAKVKYKNGEESFSQVFDKALIDEGSAILVITYSSNSLKPYGLAKLYMEQGYYVHESISTYFTEKGAKRRFVIMQGKEWDGEDVYDDCD